MNLAKLSPTEGPRCGEMAGYKRHLRRNEEACQPCKTACRDQTRLRRESNPQKAKIENKLSHLKRREQVLEKNRQYRLNNPEKVKQYQDRYRAEHKEERETYRQANLEKFRHYARKRKAWKLDNGYEPYLEQNVLDTYGTDCHICLGPIDLTASRKVGIENWKVGLHIDHLIPLAKGGGDTLENVRPAHAHCNLLKNAKVIQEDNTDYEFNTKSN